MNAGQLSKHIRASVTAKMVGSLSENFASTGVSDNSVNSQPSDEEKIYKNTRYTQQDKPMVGYYNAYPEKGVKNLWGLKSDKNNAPEYLNPARPNMKSHRYFRADFVNPEIVAQMSKQYNVSNYLFIDHFEMETHFKDCTDMQKQVSKRDIYVHYTVLGADGKFKDGGVVCTTVHSTSNDIRDILKNTLPSISDMILTQIKPILKS